MSEQTEEVVTMDEGLNWAGRLCRCNRCGVTRHCRIGFDFYTPSFRPTDKHLYCFPCLCEEARKDGAL